MEWTRDSETFTDIHALVAEISTPNLDIRLKRAETKNLFEVVKWSMY